MEKETFDIGYYDLEKIYEKLEEIFQEDEYSVELRGEFCIVTSVRKLSEEQKQSVMKIVTD